jgi:error-prone DNA polymerase
MLSTVAISANISSSGDGYAALWCKSAYSFLEGASHPDELVEEAHRLGVRAIALTDRDGVYGVVRAWVKARELGVHLIVGSEITLFDASTIVLLAMTRAGYASLCRLISKGRLRSPKGVSHVSVDEVCAHATDLIALWGGERSQIAGEADPEETATALKEAFGDRLYVLVTRHRTTADARRECRVRERAARFGVPTVAAIETLYHTPARRELQDVLTCVRHGVTLGTAGRRMRPNAEHALASPHGFSMLFADDPDSVARTLDVAERCRFSLAEIRYRYPCERLPDGSTSSDWLRELTLHGARDRYPNGVPDKFLKQIAKELALIRELEYDGYFLTMYEIVRFCRETNILCQGRGSAANSTVCY